MIWTHLDKYRDAGLLLLRFTFGGVLAFLHGWGKVAGGPEVWAKTGGIMEIFGLGFAPSFWGFMAGFAEFFCALAVIVGFLTRPALILLVVNMFVATMAHAVGPFDFGGWEKAALFGFVFLSLVFTGPGKYSVDEMMG